MRPHDPYRRYCFSVQIDGLPVAAFQSVTGLDTQIQMMEYREGTDPNFMRKIPGLSRFESNIVLSRGFTQDNGFFWNWFRELQEGIVNRVDGSIILCDEMGEDRIRWEFESGWLCMLAGAELDAASNEVAVQRAEICYENLSANFLG